MRRSLITFATLLALLATAQLAHASGKAVLDDCTDDERMSKTYSQADYRSALGQLAADTDQYGNCRDVIRRAMLAAAGAGKGTKSTTKDKQPAADDKSGVVGSEPSEKQLSTATPAERAGIDKARTTPTITAPTVDPTTAGTAPTASQGTSLPTPLIVLLGLLGAGLLALAAVKIKNLVNARRG